MSAIPYTHLDKLYIDGNWERACGTEPVLNPATELPIGRRRWATTMPLAPRSRQRGWPSTADPGPDLAMAERTSRHETDARGARRPGVT